ncbi:MAG: LamG-like jellyroll fold domain-containing protein [Bacteroidota bacterium]
MKPPLRILFACFILHATLYQCFAQEQPRMTFICGTALNGNGPITQGWKLPASGTLRALWIVCKFSDDNFDLSPFTDRWPSTLNTPETFPAWTHALLSTTQSQSYPLETISGWYKEMSLGQLHIIGDVYRYVPQHEQSFYYRAPGADGLPLGDDRRRGLGYLNHEVLRAVDSIYNIDFTQYDNWKYENGQWIYAPGTGDGIVDLIIITYRFYPSTDLTGGHSFSGLAMLDWYNQDGFFPITIDGKTIVYDQGVTNRLHAPEGGIQTTAHEMGHLLYGYFHHAGIGLNLAGFNAYERWLMGWINPRHADRNQSVSDLNDFITTGDAIRIPTPDPTEFFLVENHQKLNAYETFPRWHGGPPQFGGDPGLYVFHVDEKIPESGDSRRLFAELASGRYDWRKTTYQGTEYYNFPFEIIGPNIASGVTIINLPFTIYDTQSGTVRTLGDPEAASAGIHGNQYDTFHEGFKTEFSYTTNPATNLSMGNQDGSTLTSVALRNIRKIQSTNFMAFDLQLTPPAPTLASPANGATGISTSPTLSWNASTGATSYRLQVSTSSGFGGGTIVYDDSNITATSRQIGALQNGTTYYWHVNAKNAAGTSDWPSPWSFTTISSAPPPPTLLAPSNGATGISTSPTLSWNSSTGATSYRLQVSTDTSFSPTVFDQSGITTTSYSVSGLANSTTYYWHVNASNEGGPSAWSSTWSFTTLGPAPPAPTLLAPPNGMSDLETNQMLYWNASSGATSYQLQVSANSDFSTTVLNQSGITSTSYGVAGLANSTTYYWRVNATGPGGTSSWSATWSFTTESPPQPPPIPTLLSPDNGAYDLSTSLTVSWNASSGATSYQLQVSTNSSFSSTVLNQSGITSTSYTVSGLANNTTYYWRVNATNAVATSNWSSTWSFTTISSPPPPPTLSSPSNGATGISTSPTLSWNASSGATSYELDVSTNSSFSTFVLIQRGIWLTSYTVSGLANNTTYYWRVNATSGGGTSDWSTTWSFTAECPVPARPTLVFPSAGAQCISTSLTLRWNTSTGATSYNLKVARDPDFSVLVLNQTGVADTSWALSGLSYSATYYWQVSATNSCGTSAWSYYRTFTTGPAPPPAPALVLPLDGQTGISIIPMILWSPVSGAISYRLQVSRNSGFDSSAIVFDSTLTSNGLMVGPLQYSTTYYWHVNATGYCNPSAWTSTWSFTTQALPPPPQPALSSPANSSAGVSTSPTLSWNASARATSYQLQVSTNSDFSTTVLNQSGITSTSYTVSGLANNTTYYWRVNATNTGGTSEYSAVWSFTTVLPAPVLATPANGATGIATNPTLTWNASSGATSYRVQVSTKSTFESTIADQSGITTTSYALSGLATNTSYYWHVNATNSGGTSAYSTTSSFTTVTALPGLVASYAFSEGTGTTTADSSGNQLTGTISGASWTTQGKYGNALSFNGTGSYVNLYNPTQLCLTGSMTLCAWINASAYPVGDGTIIAKSTSTAGWQLKTTSGQGAFIFAIAVSPNSTSITQRNSNTVGCLNTWYHVAGVYNGWPRALDIFVNGVLYNGNLAGTIPTTQYNSSVNVYIGKRFGSGNHYFSGIIDQVHVYNRALTSTEIQTDMNSWSCGSPSAAWIPGSGSENASALAVMAGRESEIPSEYRLEQNFPNPFNPSTVFEFALPKQTHVKLEMFNLLGERVAAVVDETLSAGYYSVPFNGVSLATGVYFYRMQTDDFVQTKKLLILK